MPTKLIDRITEEENFYQAFKQTRKGQNKYKLDAMVFNQDKVYNLTKLRNSVKNGTYEFGGYNRFTVYEPKERVIDAPKYKDKIVQIAIHNVIKHVYFPSFIHDSYSKGLTCAQKEYSIL